VEKPPERVREKFVLTSFEEKVEEREQGTLTRFGPRKRKKKSKGRNGPGASNRAKRGHSSVSDVWARDKKKTKKRTQKTKIHAG